MVEAVRQPARGRETTSWASPSRHPTGTPRPKRRCGLPPGDKRPPERHLLATRPARHARRAAAIRRPGSLPEACGRNLRHAMPRPRRYATFPATRNGQPLPQTAPFGDAGATQSVGSGAPTGHRSGQDVGAAPRRSPCGRHASCRHHPDVRLATERHSAPSDNCALQRWASVDDRRRPMDMRTRPAKRVERCVIGAIVSVAVLAAGTVAILREPLAPTTPWRQ